MLSQHRMNRTQEERALTAARLLLEDVVEGDKTITGRLHGHTVTFAVSSGTGWACWSVHVKAHLAVTIDIRQRLVPVHGSLDGGDIFFANFSVHAASQKGALAIVTKKLQRRVIALRPNRLTLKPQQVQLTKRYTWYYSDGHEIREGIELAVALAESASGAILERNSPLPTAVVRQAQSWTKTHIAVVVTSVLYSLYWFSGLS